MQWFSFFMHMFIKTCGFDLGFVGALVGFAWADRYSPVLRIDFSSQTHGKNILLFEFIKSPDDHTLSHTDTRRDLSISIMLGCQNCA